MSIEAKGAPVAIAVPASSSIQYRLLLAAGIGAGGSFAYLLSLGAQQAMLLLIGIALGIALYHAAFGFTGAYRRALLERDISGVSAQMAMLAAAMLLFAPILAQVGVFGRPISGALAPVSLSMALGAFIFGIGMQVGGACASGSLFTAGGGNLRILLVLAFFCVGTFWGSLDLHWWQTPARHWYRVAGSGIGLDGGRGVAARRPGPDLSRPQAAWWAQ